MKYLFKRRKFFLAITILLISCNSVSQSGTGIFNFPFDLNTPEDKYPLPAELSEVSGLAFNEGKIFCVQDESANIYVFDPSAGKVLTKYISGRKGDFEDIAIIGSTAYLLKSSGTLVEVSNFSKENRTFTEHDTPLSPKNDTEGLAYDSSTGSLLISCKEYPGLKDDKNLIGSRTIYRFTINNMQLETDPYITINLRKSECFADKGVFEKFQSFRDTRPEIIGFKPSGIAFHPSTKEMYVISGSGRLILVLDINRKIKLFGYLPPDIFVQPEGICFSTEGDLFISNEGKGSSGNILRFRKNNQ